MGEFAVVVRGGAHFGAPLPRRRGERAVVGESSRSWRRGRTRWCAPTGVRRYLFGEDFGGESEEGGVGLAPCAGGQACFAAGFIEKPFARPVIFFRDLRQKQP